MNISLKSRGGIMRSLSLLFKVLWSPGKVMSFAAASPCFVVPLSLIISSSLASTAIVKAKVPDLPLRVIERSPAGLNVSAEMKDRIREQANSATSWILTMIFSGLRPVLLLLIVSAIYFSIFTVIGSKAAFGAFFSITAFAFVPMVFRQIAAALTAFFVPSAAIMPDELGSLSPAVFLDRDSVSPLLFTAVNMIDIVSIWTLCLMVIGFAFVTRRKVMMRGRAAVVFGVFLAYELIKMIIQTI
jgi:Yip1 domain